MASVINIGADNASDQFYRYKMPKLQARIEGRGNGIKTNVVNNVEVAKALERPPDYLVKFYGCELGAQTKYDKKSGTSIVNGAHDTSKLCELLESFIKKYVQCYSCGNPETVVKIRKDNIFLKCKACGAVSDVDMRHRLNTYILKNPPEDKISKAEKKVKKQEKEKGISAAIENNDKDEKKKKKKDKDGKKKKKDGDEEGSNEGSADADDDEDEEDEVVWMTDTSEEAAKARAQEQLTAAMASIVTQGNIEAEAAERRKREEKRLAEEAAAREAEEERKRAEEEAAAKEAAELAANPVLRLRKFIAAGNSAADVAAELKTVDVVGGHVGRMRVLYEALFGDLDEGVKLAAQVKARKDILTTAGGDTAMQLAQLVALEYLLGVATPARIKEVAMVLKVFYDEDIVEEALIVGWYGRVDAAKVLGVDPSTAAAVRAVAKPLVEWLQEAESEEESDEDE
ncbi:Eukaryotic translation initiation factor 5 [Coccomyxa sp. Obi]|nr:Eukaryotic translation initiation factor 5 [Coccomyxa sp. Obi]